MKISGRQNNHHDQAFDVRPNDYKPYFDTLRGELHDPKRLNPLPYSVNDYDLDQLWHPEQNTPYFMREALFNDAIWLRVTSMTLLQELRTY